MFSNLSLWILILVAATNGDISPRDISAALTHAIFPTLTGNVMKYTGIKRVLPSLISLNGEYKYELRYGQHGVLNIRF